MKEIEIDLLLSKLRREIAKDCSSLEDVQIVLQQLASTDWSEYSDNLARRRCHNVICGYFVLPEEMIENPKISKRHRKYCVNCQFVHEARYTYPCDCCGLLYDRTNDNRVEVCGDCANFDTCRQIERNLSRASSKKLTSTLTVRQWLMTLEHFQHCCAYCGVSQAHVEHYIPITRGGGTTQENCIPSCNTCNLRKGNRLPSTFESLFPKERIDAIKAYQATVAAITPIPHAFQIGNRVSNVNAASPYYNAVGTIARVHEWMLGCDVTYEYEAHQRIWGENLRWIRSDVFESETDLVLA